MEKGRLTLLLLALALSLAGVAPAESETEMLAREFRQLRTIRGWFSGGDHFIPEVDSWQGRKHFVMARLGELLGDGRHTAAQAEELLGPPDAVRSQGDRLMPGPEERYLVYHWRGWHDFLYFACQDGKITRSDWWMAYE